MANTSPTSSAGTLRANRVGAALGVFSGVVSLLAIIATVLLSGQFLWMSSALSDLGRPDWNSTAVFNLGLIAAGLLALPLGIVLARNVRTLLHAAGSVAFSLSAVCLALIGVFALPAARTRRRRGGVFLGFTVALLAYGVGTCARAHVVAASGRSRWRSSMCSRGRRGSVWERRVGWRFPNSSALGASRRGYSRL